MDQFEQTPKTELPWERARPNRAKMNIEALKMGLVMGGFLIGYTVVMHYGGLILSASYQLLSYVMAVLATYMGTRNFRDTQLGGYMRYGNAFGMSMLILLYGSLLYGVFMYIYYATFGADLIPLMMERDREAAYKVLEQFGMSESKIDEAWEASEGGYVPWRLAVGHAFNVILWGGLLSLVSCIFVKRRPEQLEPPMP